MKTLKNKERKKTMPKDLVILEKQSRNYHDLQKKKKHIQEHIDERTPFKHKKDKYLVKAVELKQITRFGFIPIWQLYFAGSLIK